MAEVPAESAFLPVPSRRVEEHVENLVGGPVGVGGPDEGGGGGGDGGGGAGSALSVAVVLEGVVAPARDVTARSSDVYAVSVRGELRYLPIAVRRGDAYHLRVRSWVLLPVAFFRIIPYASEEKLPLALGILDCSPLILIRVVTRERHADDLRITVRSRPNCVLSIPCIHRIFVLEFRVTDPHGDDLHPWSEPSQSTAVTRPRDQLSHVGAVPPVIIVLITWGTSGVEAFENLPLQGRCRWVDTRIDDSNLNALAHCDLPHFLSLHSAEVPLLGLHVRCGRLRQTGEDHTPRSDRGQCDEHTLLGPVHSRCHSDFRTFPGCCYSTTGGTTPRRPAAHVSSSSVR